MKKFLKVAGLLVAGGIAGWLKGIGDTAYCVGKGDVTKEQCEKLTKAVDDLKSVTKGTKATVKETAEDITETMSNAAEEVAEAVEEAVSEVVPDIEVTTTSEESDDQPED